MAVASLNIKLTIAEIFKVVHYQSQENTCDSAIMQHLQTTVSVWKVVLVACK